jgi:glycosyltransferase involved in cell wall biosynthesis
MRIRGIISREGADLVNAHGSKDGWSAGLAARLAGRKVVRSRHVANPIRGHWLGRIVYGPLCDRIVTTSESIRRGMAERGVSEQKIVSIPTGVDTAVFHPGVAGGIFRSEFGVPHDAPLVGMVSVLRGDKGPDVFIRAAETVLGEVPEAMFALVGDGWMRPRLEAMVKSSSFANRFVMPGYRRDIPRVMADLDVLALPAKAPEGVPQVILQAHAMKVPVAASDVGGINEVAIDGKTALLVNPGKPGELARAIVRLLKDRAFAESLADAGYALVHERYTLGGMLDRMEALYREVLAS